MPKESTFLRRKPESGCFGHRRSHQHYQGVLNTVCTLCKLYTKAVFGDKYLHYLYFLSAGHCRVAKCKKVKEWKWFKTTIRKTEINWSLQLFVVNHLLVIFLLLYYQTFCNPGSLDGPKKNGNSLVKFGEIWCQRFFWRSPSLSIFHNCKRTDQRAGPSGEE